MAAAPLTRGVRLLLVFTGERAGVFESILPCERVVDGCLNRRECLNRIASQNTVEQRATANETKRDVRHAMPLLGQADVGGFLCVQQIGSVTIISVVALIGLRGAAAAYSHCSRRYQL